MSIDTLVRNHREETRERTELLKLVGADPIAARPTPADATARLETLREGLGALDDMVEAGDVVQFFLDHSRAQGGRLLLLRRWTNGLRVMLAEGVTLPERMLDPKAQRPKVISSRPDDVFSLTAAEKVVYSGPFPQDAFPEDLAAHLPGDENRPVLIIPLPLRGKWGTYLYLDWVDFTAADRIAEAALLARYAVLRLHCLEEGVLPVGLHVREVLNREEARQRERQRSDFADLQPGDLPAEVLYGLAGDLQAMPQVAGRILELLGEPNATAAQLEKEIVQDLVLTAKILRVANSSFYESISEARTIRDAIVRLGFKNVRNWTLVNASRTAFPGVESDPRLHRIWLGSVHSAVGAQLAADAAGYRDRETAFTGGLIQNIGQLILARALPGLADHIDAVAAAQQVPLWRAEQLVLGYDHGTLGALLIHDWKLSEDLAHAVRFHHHLQDDAERDPLGAVIALGEEAAGLLSVEAEEERRDAWERSAAARALEVDGDACENLWRRLKAAETEDMV